VTARLTFAGVPAPTREDEEIGHTSAAIFHALRTAVEGTRERAADDGEFATMAGLLEKFKAATVPVTLARPTGVPGQFAPGVSVRVLNPAGATLDLSPGEAALVWRLWASYERTGLSLAEAPLVLAVRLVRDALRNWDAVTVGADGSVGRPVAVVE
jgi:hypothetical protein